jgi:hypothetical protein
LAKRGLKRKGKERVEEGEKRGGTLSGWMVSFYSHVFVERRRERFSSLSLSLKKSLFLSL